MGAVRLMVSLRVVALCSKTPPTMRRVMERLRLTLLPSPSAPSFSAATWTVQESMIVSSRDLCPSQESNNYRGHGGGGGEGKGGGGGFL